jgi:hypothetical protein
MARCQIGPNCFVIFVVLLDEFDHFGQTFCDINVSIDSVTLEGLIKAVTTLLNGF